MSHGAIAVLTCIVSLWLHELGHAAASKLVGDRRGACRLTLKPLVNLDPLFSLVMPVITAFLSGGLIAWGMGRPFMLGRQRVSISLAGPAVNLLLMGICGAVGFDTGYYTNAMLAAWNLLPIEGFDGEHAIRAYKRDHLPYRAH